MNKERAISLCIDQQESLAILHEGEPESDLAVVIVVGGPQYRIGSHRQFIQLARFLADKGITCLRFDSRGMGDSLGNKQPFDDLNVDINTVIDTLQAQLPQIKRVVLWGLCDAASATMIYAHQDARVKGLVLLNPWLENDQARAKTMVKYYYLQRLLSKDFWKKIIQGKVNLTATAKDAGGLVKSSFSNAEVDDASYQNKMLSGLQRFSGKICLITSGQDFTAQEFLNQVKSNKSWHRLQQSDVLHCHILDADHTFSKAEFKQQVTNSTYSFIQQFG